MNLPELWWPVRRLLERHLTRLRDSLDVLGERLREALAGTVGKAVADAVREVMQRLLTLPTGPPDTHDRRYHDPWERNERDSWEEDDSPWGRQRYSDDDDYDHDEPPATKLNEPSAPPRWQRAVALGLQGVAWLLRRQFTGVPLASALGLGLFASTAAYVRGLTILTVAASVVAAVLGLLNLVENAAIAAGVKF